MEKRNPAKQSRNFRQNRKDYQNGAKYEVTAAGTIAKPQENSTMMIGVNPKGSNPAQDYFVGKVYAVRIYNRALSEDEVLHNYQVDKRRYQMFE